MPDSNALAVRGAIPGIGQTCGRTAEMFHPVQRLVVMSSRYITLMPTDILCLGAVSEPLIVPAECGLAEGTTLEVEVSGLPVLRATLMDQRRSPQEG